MFEKTANRSVASTINVTPTNNVTPLAEAMAEANGSVTNVATIDTVDVRAVPDSIELSAISAKNAEAGTKVIYFFNEDKYDDTPTHNNAAGTGGGTITTTYSDGRSGKKINEMIRNANGGKGIKIKGITAIAKSEGVLDEAFFATCKMAVKYETAEEDQPIFLPIKWTKAISNSPQKDGIYKLKTNFTLNYLAQLQFKLAATAANSAQVDLILEVDNG